MLSSWDSQRECSSASRRNSGSLTNSDCRRSWVVLGMGPLLNGAIHSHRRNTIITKLEHRQEAKGVKAKCVTGDDGLGLGPRRPILAQHGREQESIIDRARVVARSAATDPKIMPLIEVQCGEVR